MDSVREIESRIRAKYASLESGGSVVPLPLAVLEWVSRAKEYAEAARLIRQSSPQLVLPALQLDGQAIELALKAFLAASGISPPRRTQGHDLIKLSARAIEVGLRICERDLAMIVLLYHFYYADLVTATKFKARYPTPDTEPLGGAIPDGAVLSAVVQSMCTQAHAANRESLRRLGWLESDLPT